MEVDEESVKWCTNELFKILNCPPSEEIVRYILGIEDKDELEEFLEHVLGDAHNANKNFVVKLLNYQRLSKIKKESGRNVVVYKKGEELNYIESQTKPKNKNKKGLQQICEKSDAETVQKEQSVRKKTHYLPLYSQDGEHNSVLIPGRHPCTCEASKHKLINNCLHCGRIVCQQEGSGPCMTCGELVCTPGELEVISRGSKKSAKLHDTLMKASTPDTQLKKAIDHKNKLLEFNRTSAQRTQIIDDETDYFSLDGNKWMTKEQRQVMAKKVQELHDKRHRSRSSQMVTFDIAGRRVLEGDGGFNYQRETEDLKALAASFSSLKYNNESPAVNVNSNPSLQVPAPVYQPSRHNRLFNTSESSNNNNNRWHQAVRIQDRELQEITDEGMCLSLHQPWASLLVMGIKRHEGRTWYTHYRGLIWIHAASKVPTVEEVTEIEKSHKLLHRNECAKFPEQYPVSCLLGCLTLADCLPQEEYRAKYPDGESASPYVFICEKPQELILKFPMKGKHKIFKLDSNIHKAAKNTLRKLIEK